MFWKIYFYGMCLILLLSVVGILTTPHIKYFAVSIYAVLICIEFIGLFSYSFRKRIFSNLFWRIYFWVSNVLNLFWLLYILFPHVQVLKLYSILALEDKSSLVDALIGMIIDLPAMYMIFRLSQGKFPVENEKKIKKTASGAPQWGMVQTALWGYSMIISIYFGLLSLVPSSPTSHVSSSSNESSLLVFIILPLFLFWFGIALKYKHYLWNWWRVTLFANGLLYSGMIIFSLLFDSAPSSDNGGFNYIAIAQFGIIIAGLFIFGREQIHRENIKKEINS